MNPSYYDPAKMAIEIDGRRIVNTPIALAKEAAARRAGHGPIPTLTIREKREKAKRQARAREKAKNARRARKANR